jgi:tRNA threonylcarbamoyladenosine biosynthesis protein TsaB
MLILTLRTDKPEAEIGLYEDNARLAYDTWYAHRELSTTLHRHIDDLLAAQGKTREDLQAIVCYQGPGSFTGLRIGLTVADALAYALKLPIVESLHDDWIQSGINRLKAGEDDHIALPYYGADAHITPQKK